MAGKRYEMENERIGGLYIIEDKGIFDGDDRHIGSIDDNKVTI